MALRGKILGMAAALVVSACGAPLLAEGPASKAESRKTPAGKFIRVQRDLQGRPTKLETAIVRYAPATAAGGVVVDLVGAVHVGDRSYYRELNDKLAEYDVVLYELVAPPGTRIPKGGRRNLDNPIALVQQLMKFVLDLQSQTEQIDYTRKNFVHADLSPEQMAKAIRDRGDDGLTLFLSITADLLRQQNLQQQHAAPAGSREDIDLSSLLEPEGAVKLKRIMAEQMERLGTPGMGLGPTLNTILIADRNQACLKVLQKELAKGRKKIAIFYGAAHLPDFDKRLREDFGLARRGEEWLTAWDIRVKEKTVDDVLDLLKLLDK